MESRGCTQRWTALTVMRHSTDLARERRTQQEVDPGTRSAAAGQRCLQMRTAAGAAAQQAGSSSATDLCTGAELGNLGHKSTAIQIQSDHRCLQHLGHVFEGHKDAAGGIGAGRLRRQRGRLSRLLAGLQAGSAHVALTALERALPLRGRRVPAAADEQCYAAIMSFVIGAPALSGCTAARLSSCCRVLSLHGRPNRALAALPGRRQCQWAGGCRETVVARERPCVHWRASDAPKPSVCSNVRINWLVGQHSLVHLRVPAHHSHTCSAHSPWTIQLWSSQAPLTLQIDWRLLAGHQSAQNPAAGVAAQTCSQRALRCRLAGPRCCAELQRHAPPAVRRGGAQRRAPAAAMQGGLGRSSLPESALRDQSTGHHRRPGLRRRMALGCRPARRPDSALHGDC